MIKRFDFKCTNCDHIEEQWVDGSDEFATCPLNVVKLQSG